MINTVREYKTIQEVNGQFVLINQVNGVKYGELCEIETNGTVRRGIAAEVDGSDVIVQLFESSAGINPARSKARFLGRGFELSVSDDMIGRIFSGIGEPIDDNPAIVPEITIDINGVPINPVARRCSAELIQTGISAIDGICALSTGQTLPVISSSGLPHADLAVQIIRQAKLINPDSRTQSNSNPTIVFAAVGLTFEEADFYISNFHQTGTINRTVAFINLASDPAAEKMATPRTALTAAEFLAYEKNMNVLVVMVDMTNYTEAIREVYAARKEITGRGGFANSIFSDLASIYERAGQKLNSSGSVTVIPIFTMHRGDKENKYNAISVASGYVTLSGELHGKGCVPPIDIAASAAKSGGKNISKEHADIMNRLAYCYARGTEIRNRRSILTAGAPLSESDMSYVKFADAFEYSYINQGFDRERSIEQTISLGLKILDGIQQ